MFEDIDKRFEEILEIAKSNGLPLDIIKKAYAKAKELHREQKRKDGYTCIIRSGKRKPIGTRKHVFNLGGMKSWHFSRKSKQSCRKALT